MFEDEMLLGLNNADCLAHYGVKGMRWGVRKKDPERSARRKQAKQYQKDLNKIDRRMQYDSITAYNAGRNKIAYERKAQKYYAKGKINKSRENLKKAKRMDELSKAYIKDYVNTGEKYADMAMKMYSEGYRFKIKNIDLNSPNIVTAKNVTKDMTLKYGKHKIPARYANASGANKWKVKDASQVSDKRYQIWKANNQNVQKHIPGQISVYYY